MRKVCYGVMILLLVLCMVPIKAYAEEITFGQMLDDLEKAQKELDRNQQSIDNDKNEIINKNETIKKLKNEIEEMKIETTKLQQEIADSSLEIDEKKGQTKDLISYLQMSQGENIYLEYVFGGETVTDLIYRMSIVEQITEYNEKIIKDLQALIQKNEDRKVELANQEKSYENKITSLNSEISKLNSSISNLGELSPSLKQEVEAKKSVVDYYRKEGCKNRTDVIGRDCAVTSSNATFYRPIRTGYVTSFIGYRWGSLHRGIDLGSPNGRNTELYSIGYGVVKSLWKDGNGALCVNVQYKTSNGQYYTAIYAHLSRYGNIYEGMKVDPNTVLGYMGDTGYAFGVHLHLEVWPCRIYEDNNCRTWTKYVNFVSQKFNEGFRGAESVISFPSRTYQTWYNK